MGRESADDILEVLGPMAKSATLPGFSEPLRHPNEVSLNTIERTVLKHIGTKRTARESILTASGLAAETVSAGDPTFAGPLAGVPLGLKAYHMLELKDEVDAAVYEEQIAMMEMVLDVDAIKAEVATYRG